MVAVHKCTQCVQHPPAFTWLKTIGIHADDLQLAVHELKYAGRFHLAHPLAQLLLQRLHREISNYAPQTIIPVPLHPKRLRERGYNQSLLVAQQLGSALKIDISSDYLLRIRATRSQTDLTRKERQQNLHGAFTLHGAITPQRILLVDDVVTTTATCRECATILVSAGHEVAVVALGRARLHS
jgi:ComF family protein